jgi:hypothetical protein
MSTVITEATLKEKCKTLVSESRWKKVCLLVLFLVPGSKFASRNFIYEKLQNWGILNLEGDNKLAFLRNISIALYDLYEEESVKKEDLSRMNQVAFDKFCALRVAGAISACAKHRTQTVYKISPKGKILVRDVFGHRRIERYNSQDKVAVIRY